MSQNAFKLGDICWVNFRVADLIDEVETLVFECRISRIFRQTIEDENGTNTTLSVSVTMVDDIWEKATVMPQERIHPTKSLAAAAAIAELEERSEKARVAGVRRETLISNLRTIS